jgi:RimJ/RimL family protein N-acetyltransferase
MTEINLVDFTEEYTSLFYEWMQDADLLRLTGTDRMTLEEIKRLSEKSLEGKCIIKIILLDDTPIGDIDLFYSIDEDLLNCGEINILIVQKQYRSKGYGKRALLKFLDLLRKPNKALRPDYLCAKINKDNKESIALFESVGFVKEDDVPNVFDEYKLIYQLINLNDATEMQQ